MPKPGTAPESGESFTPGTTPKGVRAGEEGPRRRKKGEPFFPSRTSEAPPGAKASKVVKAG